MPRSLAFTYLIWTLMWINAPSAESVQDACAAKSNNLEKEVVMNLKPLLPIGRERVGPESRGTSPFWMLEPELDRWFDVFGKGLPSFGWYGSSDMAPRMD